MKIQLLTFQAFLKQLFFLLMLIGFALPVSYGQVEEEAEAEQDTSQIELRFARKMRGTEGPEGETNYVEGDVHFQQGQMHLWCDTAHKYPDKQVLAYGNVQMLQNDSIRIFSDSLFYNSDVRKARLSGDVVLQDSTMTMFTNELLYDLNTKIADYPNGALIVTDSSQLTAKSGSYDVNTSMAFFKDSVRLSDPNYKLTADSLAFDTDREKAYFIGPTYIYDKENLVYCEDGYYDNRKNEAMLLGNPYYILRNEEGYKEAKGDTILYDGNAEKYYLIGNAVFNDGEKEVRADTIVRDDITGQFYFKGKPKFNNLDSTKNQTIDSEFSYYDDKTKTLIFRENVRIVDDNQVLMSDSLDYKEEEHIAIARGRVIWEDTTSDVRIMCGEAIYNDSTESFLAKEHPILMTEMGNDSLWLTADTLRAWPDSMQADKRNFYAYYNVKIYKSDMQGLCDSLTYSEADSLFEFFVDPILWVDSVQLTADTIRSYLKEKKLYKSHLLKNALIVSTEEEKYFNQIRGKDIIAHFNNNKLHRMDVTANGEVIYYAIDEQQRYIGVNDVDCSKMFINFKENNVDRIKFLGTPQAVMLPMGSTPHSTLRLKGFRWLEEKRPKTKFEITGNYDWSARLAPNLAIDSVLLLDSLPKNEQDTSIGLPPAPQDSTVINNKKGKLDKTLPKEDPSPTKKPSNKANKLKGDKIQSEEKETSNDSSKKKRKKKKGDQ